MADRAHSLQQMADTVGRFIEDGFTEEEISEMLAAAMAHVCRGTDVSYVRGTCINCGAVHVGWSEYQWALMVQTPCRSCG